LLSKILEALTAGTSTIGKFAAGALTGAGQGALAGTAVGSFFGGVGSVPGAFIGTALGAIVGGLAGLGGAKAAGGMITGPGTATSDNILTPTSAGEYVVNAAATQQYGAGFLNAVNNGTYAPSQPTTTVVKIDTNAMEAKLDRIAAAMANMGNMKVQMSGYDVGNVSLNDRTPLFTAAQSRVVG
jgi:hypothetical protein